VIEVKFKKKKKKERERERRKGEEECIRSGLGGGRGVIGHLDHKPCRELS
jgi:hypothetical protein